ncbi:LemA family protein [Novipirellula maiorica]|nr:LemA family protein [Rhodopirellula maiorica]
MINAVVIGLAAGLLFAVGIFVVRTYNVLLASFEETRNSFAQIEVQLKRRYDLIPSLVEAARAYLTHERETLEAVIEARQQASSKLSGLQNISPILVRSSRGRHPKVPWEARWAVCRW